MATITLRGRNEPVITDYQTAQKVKTWWFDNNVPAMSKIDIGDLSCQKSEIKQISLSAMNERAISNKKVEDGQREYDQYRKGRLALSPETRAQSTVVFDLLYRSATQTKPVYEVIQKAIAIQTEFFRSNPYRIYTNPELFRDLIPSSTEKLSVWDQGGIRAIECAVAEDMTCARYKR